MFAGYLANHDRAHSPYGIYPWVSALVMGNLMGRRFWVGCGWFFSWGEGGGEEETPGHVQHGFFFAGRREFPNSPFYVMYYILISGGFGTSCVRPSRTVSPILDALGRHV